MSRQYITIFIIAVLIGVAGYVLYFRGQPFTLPEGESVPLSDEAATATPPDRQAASTSSPSDATARAPETEPGTEPEPESVTDAPPVQAVSALRSSQREVRVTDGTKHSIPIDEILSGGPPKDGIPSVDEPKFISASEAEAWLGDDDIGLGIFLDGTARFYPYQILVWHEIVNEQFPAEEGSVPLAVTYCPLCQTGVVYDRRAGDEVMEFGVSGMLWQSNLLMYNREEREEEESLWSQVLGEAVLGPDTGTKLAIVRSDTVRFGDWVAKHPQTQVLSRNTGFAKRYGVDPYGDYYTDNSAIFFPTDNADDARLEAKDFVLGVEVNGQYKAYLAEAISQGVTTDQFAGETITIEKSDIGEVTMFVGEAAARKRLPYIGGFWFSWVAVHPETEVYK